MAPLPSFIATANLKEVLGDVDDDELVEEALSRAAAELTSNVPPDAFVKWEGNLKRIETVYGRFDTDGNLVNKDGGPLKLLAQDDGLNIRGLQWRCHISIPQSVIPPAPSGMMRSFWFNASGDGTTLNLNTVVPTVAVPLAGVATPFTPYFQPVPDTDPQQYQAYDPLGNPVGDPFVLEAYEINEIDGGDADGSGTDTIDGGGA